ncbi:MAG: M6 family metalloprotease domain-containing protein [Bacteroidales bacterium]|nr:M6 family metalloprotease domain-containing protein [Bacteroidales bacterium]
MRKQTRHIALLLALLLALAPSAFANRAPMREIRFTQPDGSIFYGRNIGDQYLHYTVDRDGAILVQDNDGWWCYACFDEDNHFQSTGIRVGKAGKGVVKKVTEIPRYLVTDAREQKTSVPDKTRSRFRRNEKTRAFSGAKHSVARTGESTPVIRGLVLLAGFQDTSFVYTKADFNNLLNQEGYSRAGAVGCAKEYFRAQFGDEVRFEFEVEGPYTLPHAQYYYGANDAKNQDKNPAQMIADVCQMADADVDFTQYDADGDDYIDNVFVFYAGCNEADGGIPASVWPHSWYVQSGAHITVMLDGKTLDRYACTSEKEYRNDDRTYMASIGTFCHEFSHTLGLLDLYDTDYDEDSKRCAVGCRGITALMDAGNRNNNGNTPPNYNAIDRLLLKDYFPQPLPLTEGDYSLKPVSEGGNYYYVPADVEGEYFLFECRDNTSGWDRYIGGSGLLVYHVDFSDNLTGSSQFYKDGEPMTALERWYYNEINANVDAQCGYIVPADESLPMGVSRYDYITGSYYSTIAQAYFPQGSSSFSAANGFRFRSGQDAALALSHIRMEGTSVCFTVGKVDLPPAVTESRFRSVVLQDCQIFSWQLPEATDAKCIVRFGGISGATWNPQQQELTPYAPGCYAVVFDKLLPLTSYKLEVFYTADGLTGKRYFRTFITMKKNVGNGTPFISFKNVERNADGSFPVGTALPLRLMNAIEAQSVEWYFNGKAVTVDGSGFYTPDRSGVLRAVLRDKDGVESIVSKQINIR